MTTTSRSAISPQVADSRTASVSVRKGAFWQMLRRVAVLGATIDVLLFVVFHAFGMPALAWINVASVAMYAAAYWLLGRRRNLQAVLLMWCEVLIHSAVCSVFLGWESGAHYFMMVFIPAVALSRSTRHAVAALVFLLLVYLGVNGLTMAIAPLYAMSAGAALTMRCISVTTVFVMFGYIGRYYVQRVDEAERQLQDLAARDQLSGLANRREVVSCADVELERGKRAGTAMAVLLADIDHFKRVNDAWGHATGDRLIQHVASTMSRSLRPTDVLGRWGGEEFIALLPVTSLEEATAIAERLRAAIADSAFEVDGERVRVTVSVGVQPVDAGRPFGEAVAAADAAMYRAKQAGRDAVVTGAARAP